MPSVTLSVDVSDRLRLLGKAWGTNEDQTIRRLLTHFQKADGTSTDASDDLVRVHAVYRGERIEAAYDPDTQRVEILSGPLQGQSFNSPSGAAIGVVQYINPKVHPNRNGWTFWYLDSTGEALQSMRTQ
jgi:hypothetical protein